MALSNDVDIGKFFNFSKNPMVEELSTDAYETAPGTNAYQVINPGTGSGANAVGGTLTLVWATGGVVFTVATTPDGTGTQVRPKLALSNNAFGNQLIVDMMKNYDFSENFTVTNDGTGKLTITAINVGTEFALHPNFATLNFGYQDSAHNDGSDKVFAPNYKMRADLWMESAYGEGDYAKVATQELDPVLNKYWICDFDFQTEVNANLSYDLPAYAQTGITACLQVVKRFFVRFLEKFGSPVADNAVDKTEVGDALKAGIPMEQYLPSPFNLFDNLYRAPTGGVPVFMTLQPRKKLIREMQAEFLYLAGMGTHGPSLHVEITSIDGSQNGHIDNTTFPTFSSKQVLCFPTGYTALNVASVCPWDNLLNYRVTVIWDGGTSEGFTYMPDRDVYVDETTILFSNSAGGVDTVRFTGAKQKFVNVEQDIVERTVLYDSPLIPGAFSNVNSLKTNPVQVNSGWITPAQADWLESLLMAEVVMIDVRADSDDYTHGKFLPIVISSLVVNKGVVKEYDSIVKKVCIELEYSVAFKNKV